MNAEWLWTPFDGHADGSRFNQGDPVRSDYEAELEFYRQLVRSERIDLFAVQEIENEQAARELATALGSEWSYAFKQGRDTATGQDVALFSRIGQIRDSTDLDFPRGFVDGYRKGKRLSKILGMRLEVVTSLGAKNIGVVTSHFLSKRNADDRKNAQRLMQAKAVVKGLAEYSDLDDLIVLGDFNDFRYSPVVKTLENEARLSNAFEACATKAISKKEMRYQVNHVLFKGFSCASVATADLSKYSDHSAVIAELVF